MEKRYEKPEVNVVRYRKRVKTQAGGEFVDSAGVRQVKAVCPYCSEHLIDIPVEEAENMSEEWARRLVTAYNEHVQEKHPDAPVYNYPPGPAVIRRD